MKRISLSTALVVFLAINPALADSAGRINLNDADDCDLYRALNGSEAVPASCKENNTRSAFEPIASVQAPQPVVLDQDAISFGFDSAHLTNASRLALQRLASAMANPASNGQVYEIGGHTDAKGNTAYNLQLSERRAGSVKAFLIAQGVKPGHLQSKGYGDYNLLDSQTPYSPVNRRVEIINISQGQ